MFADSDYRNWLPTISSRHHRFPVIFNGNYTPAILISSSSFFFPKWHDDVVIAAIRIVNVRLWWVAFYPSYRGIVFSYSDDASSCSLNWSSMPVSPWISPTRARFSPLFPRQIRSYCPVFLQLLHLALRAGHFGMWFVVRSPGPS